jgi:hypothetical protein
VRATYTDNVAAATGTLGGPATLALTGSASGFAAVLAWIGMPADFALNVSNGGVTNPTNAAAGPTGTATLHNTGTLATGPVTVAFVGARADSYELAPGQDGCTGQILAPGSSCTVGIRLRAGLFPDDHPLQLSASAPAAPTATSAVRQQRVLGPRLVILSDNQVNLNHGEWSWLSQVPHRIWWVGNVGNQPTPGMGVQITSSGMHWGLHRSNWEEVVAGSWNGVSSTATIVPQPNDSALVVLELQTGDQLRPVFGYPPGNNLTFSGSIFLGGFFLSNYTATYYGP